MAKKLPYKGSKAKVGTLVKKLIKDADYDPSEEELWLIAEYDKFNLYVKPFLKSFEKYYPAVWDTLKVQRRMDVSVFEEILEFPNFYLVDPLVSRFIRFTTKRKDLKQMLLLKKLQIVHIEDRIILN